MLCVSGVGAGEVGIFIGVWDSGLIRISFIQGFGIDLGLRDSALDSGSGFEHAFAQ